MEPDRPDSWVLVWLPLLKLVPSVQGADQILVSQHDTVYYTCVAQGFPAAGGSKCGRTKGGFELSQANI